jgi:hypothetical protein
MEWDPANFKDRGTFFSGKRNRVGKQTREMEGLERSAGRTIQTNG